jgi:cytochrome c oxidase subunit 4
MVFVGLAVLTVVTVSISYLHLPIVEAVLLAMAVAIVKGSLVAGFFMHLISERAVIYWVLLLCVVLFGALMAGPLFTDTEMSIIARADTASAAHLETHTGSH